MKGHPQPATARTATIFSTGGAWDGRVHAELKAVFPVLLNRANEQGLHLIKRK